MVTSVTPWVAAKTCIKYNQCQQEIQLWFNLGMYLVFVWVAWTRILNWNANWLVMCQGGRCQDWCQETEFKLGLQCFNKMRMEKLKFKQGGMRLLMMCKWVKHCSVIKWCSWWSILDCVGCEMSKCHWGVFWNNAFEEGDEVICEYWYDRLQEGSRSYTWGNDNPIAYICSYNILASKFTMPHIGHNTWGKFQTFLFSFDALNTISYALERSGLLNV